MATKAQEQDELDEIAQAAAKKTAAALKTKGELDEAKREITTLEKAKATAQRGWKRAQEDLETAKKSPNFVQLGTAVVASGFGTFVGWKGQELLAGATDEWVDDEGNPTFWRKALVHGTFPVLGIIGIGVGLFMANGLVSSALIGLGGGLLFSSLLRSVMLDDPLMAPADDEESPAGAAEV